MELRFIKGNWKFGKYKLQMRKSVKAEWVDVPFAEFHYDEDDEDSTDKVSRA